MVDSDRRRLITSGPRLTRDDIVNTAFPQAFRGVSEAAVRAFLRRVADEFDAVATRQQELEDLVDHLEARLAEPPPPADEPDLLTAVGEETARVLRSAKESADEIRRTAEERSAQLLGEAQDESRELRQSAEAIMAERTREAEESAAEIVREAERLARETEERAEARAREFEVQAQTDARAELEDAKRRSKEMVAEAQAGRDRLMQELTRRREALESQVDALRAGRDRLLDAYRVVKRTLDEATDALRESDSRTAPTGRRRVSSPALPTSPGERAEGRPEDDRETEEPRPAATTVSEAEAEAASEPDEVQEAAEPEAPPAPRGAPRVTSFALGELHDGPRSADPAEPTEPADAAPRAVVRVSAARVEIPAAGDTVEPAVEPVAEDTEEADDTAERAIEEPAEPASEETAEPAADDTAEAAAEHTEAEVEEIFARLREHQDETADEVPDEESASTVEAGDGPSSGDDDTPSEAETPGAPPTGDALVLARRDEALDALVPDLVRAVKRVVRDEQNLVLEGVRRAKGIPPADDVLPPVDEQDAAFADAAADCILAGCAAGESMARELGFGGGPVSGDAALARAADLAAHLARALMDPLRGRLADALSEAASLDDPDVEERVRARYREWKHQRIDETVGDALAAAFTRGLYDSLPAGVPVRWVTSGEQPCPDCADNTLEPAGRGGEFPTGHAVPPAHAGCRCIVVPTDAPQAAAVG